MPTEPVPQCAGVEWVGLIIGWYSNRLVVIGRSLSFHYPFEYLYSTTSISDVSLLEGASVACAWWCLDYQLHLLSDV